MTSHHVEIILVKDLKGIISSSLEFSLLAYDSMETAEQEQEI